MNDVNLIDPPYRNYTLRRCFRMITRTGVIFCCDTLYDYYYLNSNSNANK